MKVLLFIDTLGSGGAQRQICNLGVGLVKKGHDVSLLTYNKPFHFKDFIEENGIKHIHIQKKGKIGFGLFSSIAKLIKQEKFDYVYTYLQMPGFYILTAKMLHKFDTKVLVAERNVESTITAFQKKARKLYKLADAICANSMEQTETLKQKLPKLAHNIHYVPNGLNLDKVNFSFLPIEKNKTLKILSVGRITHIKNASFLIEALNVLVNEKGLDAKVTWVGRAPEAVLVEECKYFEYCKELIKKYKLEDRWDWAGQMQDVSKAYNSHHLMIHPSTAEGFPNVICEGLASGIAVFAGAVCDHPVIIKEGHNGYLFDVHGSVDELIGKMENHLALDQEKQMKMAEYAREYALEKFAMDLMIRTYEEFANS